MGQGIKRTGNTQKICFVQQGHSKYGDKVLVSWFLFILSVVRSKYEGATDRRVSIEGEYYL